MNKRILSVLSALLALVLCLSACGAAGKHDSGATEGTDAQGNTITGCSFTVVVVHADDSEKKLSYTAEEGTLGTFLEAEGLIDSEGADPGMFHTVDGEKADWNENQSYWAFYIEGEYAMTGIYDTQITDGVTYKLEYTIG